MRPMDINKIGTHRGTSLQGFYFGRIQYVPTMLSDNNLDGAVGGFNNINAIQRAVLMGYVTAEQVVDAELASAHDAAIDGIDLRHYNSLERSGCTKLCNRQFIFARNVIHINIIGDSCA